MCRWWSYLLAQWVHEHLHSFVIIAFKQKFYWSFSGRHFASKMTNWRNLIWILSSFQWQMTTDMIALEKWSAMLTRNYVTYMFSCWLFIYSDSSWFSTLQYSWSMCHYYVWCHCAVDIQKCPNLASGSLPVSKYEFFASLG